MRSLSQGAHVLSQKAARVGGRPQTGSSAMSVGDTEPGVGTEISMAIRHMRKSKETSGKSVSQVRKT